MSASCYTWHKPFTRCAVHSWHRECSCGEIVQAQVLGYVVGGFGTGEADEQRRGMLAASVSPLPPAALRMAAGISTPHQVRSGCS